MREAFTTACEQLQEHCADAGAALATEVRIHWLRIEAYVTRDSEMVEHLATEIFEDSGLESFYNMWNLCAMALRAVPVDASTVSALYEKACKAVTDYPDQIKDDAKKFAREAGTLQDFLSFTAMEESAPKLSASKGKKRTGEDASEPPKKAARPAQGDSSPKQKS